MCPDRELLSAWLDGEVPSPWRESIGRHVGSCAACAAAAERARLISARLREDALGASAEEERAKARVLDRLFSSGSMPSRRQLWSKRLSLPLPIAAAALVGFVAMGFALAQSGARNSELRLAVQKAVEVPSVAANGLGMESILEYLAKQDSGVSITITLPSGAALDTPGDPFIIREADYQPGSDR